MNFKWSKADRHVNFMHNLGLSSRATVINQPITFVVWPETALMPDQQPSNLTKQPFQAEHARRQRRRVWCSACSRRAGLYSVTITDKNSVSRRSITSITFVPFGEYIKAFRKYLNMMPSATAWLISSAISRAARA